MKPSAFINRLRVVDPYVLTIAMLVMLGLVIAYTLTYAAGGSSRAFPHIFYIPIIVSAYYFRVPGAMITAILAGLLCGPLMPLDTDAGTAQTTSNWLIRSAFFLSVGTVVGAGFQVMHNRIERRDRLHEEAILGFVRTIDAKSPFTATHSQHVAELAQVIGESLQLPEREIRELRWAAMLHDVGKLWIPDYVLAKTEPLTDVEWQLIRDHPERSAEFISGITEFREYQLSARHHHERFDGTGYPAGLAGDSIPFHARILAVADAFEAMTAERPYRPPLTFNEAIVELQANAGSQFDPTVAQALIRALQTRPSTLRTLRKPLTLFEPATRRH